MTERKGVLQRVIDSGMDWPISGDGIARRNAGLGSGGMIGITDHSYLEEEANERTE